MLDAISDEVKAQRLSILNDATARDPTENTSVISSRRWKSWSKVTTGPRPGTGRTSQNKTVNFTCDDTPAIGSYIDVRLTHGLPEFAGG